MRLYFQYSSDSDIDNFKIQTYPKTKTKFRKVGIDIRSDGGYIVAPPSKVNSKGYEVIRKHKVNQLPSELIDWLIVGLDRAPTNQPSAVRSPETPNSYGSSDYKFLLDDNVVKDILNRLGDEYLDDYSKWITATSSLKRHNKFKIWNDWSKRSSHHNYYKYVNLWNYNKGNVDITYWCS